MRTRAIIVILLLVVLALAAVWWNSRRRPAPPEQHHAIVLYYYDAARDTDANGNVLCSTAGLVAVPREIPQSAAPVVEDAIRLLLAGKLTSTEKAQGVTTEFPLPGVELASARVDRDGSLTLVFTDPKYRTSGGACRVGILRAQVEATARPFAPNGKVHIMPEELFQP